MNRTQKAIDWLHADPTRTQQQAADLFGIRQSCISAGLTRRRNDKVQEEREACAALAVLMDAPHVACAILKRR